MCQVLNLLPSLIFTLLKLIFQGSAFLRNTTSVNYPMKVEPLVQAHDFVDKRLVLPA
jgi:hypothetical protein